MTNYAFFDVDQTIYAGYSTPDFYLFLVTKGFGGEWTIQKDNEIGELYQSGKINYSEAGVRVVQLLADVIKDKTITEITKLANEFVELNGLKDFVPELFAFLKLHDYQVVLVSASPDPNVEAISKISQADSFHSSKFEIVHGRFTGKVVHQLDNEEKRDLILRNIENDYRGHILAFGDSTGDIPMLSIADDAFIIDPHQPEMKEIIKSHKNWYLVNEKNILDQVTKMVIGKLSNE